jgi:Fe-S-cluster-containing dehydrogenase component
MVNDFPPGQFGVKLSIFGPWPYGEGEWVFTNAPFFTEQCNCCAGLETATGQPYCVAHCQAKCLVFGELDELQKLMAAKPSQLLQGVGKR